MRNYALIKKQTGQADSSLENMLEKVRDCEGQDYANFVKEHAASIMRKVIEHDASEKNKKSDDFMKHYKLVNRIGGIEI
jgi:hypothetical protein